MEFPRIQNAIDLLGQAPPQRPRPEEPHEHRLGRAKPSVEPKLEIAWGSFHGGRWSHFAALFGPSAKAGWREASPFRDSWVEGPVPKRAVVAAALWHIAILALPVSFFAAMPRRNVTLRNIEVSWQGPIDDLPLLNIEREKAKPIPKTEPQKPASTAPKEPEIEAFHPRQRIFTDPVHPTHPRQTLINPAAPFEVPKLLPNLPNMVQFQQAGPARPRLQISEEMLAKLRPREKQATTTAASPVDAPLMEQRLAEMNLPSAQNGPARPKLEINAGAAPRVAQRAQEGETVAAPDVGSTQITSANGGANALIALSATPGPAAPVQPPQGNLAAHVGMSPEGKPGGSAAPAGPNNGSGKGAVAVSISGGDPPADSSRNAKVAAPTQRVLITRPEPKVESEDVAERTAPPDFAALPPGAKPESIFASKKVYTLNVNMPNLNSSTGSWILNFSELRTDSSRPRYAASPTDLSGPVPVKKVDPKYPPTLISERVQGEVVLYAVIRRDGSVDSIQLVRGIDEQLDANAMKALAQWQFRPAAKQGTPVELEAIVHIPFRLPEYR